MIVSFTGPSFLNRNQELQAVKTMEGELAPSEMDTWRSGCAHGLDTVAAHQAVLAGILNVELYVPAALHNEELVSELAGRVKIIQCPPFTVYTAGTVLGPPHRGYAYRERNTKMVTGSDMLAAFLKSDKFYRSGEWMTVNIAKRLGVPVKIFVI